MRMWKPTRRGCVLCTGNRGIIPSRWIPRNSWLNSRDLLASTRLSRRSRENISPILPKAKAHFVSFLSQGGGVDEIGKDENLSSVDAAIKEVLREEKIANVTAAKDIAITEGERRSWERSWNNAKEYMPELIERLDGLLDQRSKRSKP